MLIILMVTIIAKSLNEYHVLGIVLSITLILSHLILTTMLQGIYYLCFTHEETNAKRRLKKPPGVTQSRYPRTVQIKATSSQLPLSKRTWVMYRKNEVLMLTSIWKKNAQPSHFLIK